MTKQLSPSGHRLFELRPCGDPFSICYDVREYQDSFDEEVCTYRGDLSGLYSKQTLARELRRLYPGCTIRFSK